MRSSSRRAAAFVASALICLVGLAGVAWASTITQPTGPTFVVPGDGAGNPLPFTVVANGFTPTAQVFVEQCDGTSPTVKGWSPTSNCDLGTSPSPVTVDDSGKATFDASDVNHAFAPFKGESPQSLFNCLSPKGVAPANGLPSFINCQIRVSTNNTAPTADQSFVLLTLPEAVQGGTTTTTSTSTSTTSTSIPPTSTSTSTSTVPVTTTSTSTIPTGSTSTTTSTSTSTSTSTTTSTVPATTTTEATTTTVPKSTTTIGELGSTTTTLGHATSTTTDPTTPTTVQTLVVDPGTGQLPFTGGSTMPIAAGGLVLIVAGIGLALGGRKRLV
jgi:hypothetical protein